MTDRLGEALACTEDLAMCFEHAPIVRAAARAWHALTDPAQPLVDAGADALQARYPDVFGPFLAEGSSRTVMLAVLDALTVTAEEETG